MTSSAASAFARLTLTVLLLSATGASADGGEGGDGGALEWTASHLEGSLLDPLSGKMPHLARERRPLGTHTLFTPAHL